jgi:hypothetical protein
MSVEDSIQRELDSIYNEEVALRNSQYQLDRAFDAILRNYDISDLPDDIDRYEEELDVIEENLEEYEATQQIGQSTLEVNLNDIEAARLFYSTLENNEFDKQVIEDVSEVFESYFDRLENIRGVSGSVRRDSVAQTLFHYISSFEAEDGEVSPICVSDDYRERKQANLQNQVEDYNLFEDAIANFEGVFFLEGDKTSEESTPLIEEAYSQTGNKYGLENLEWWNDDGFESTPEERNAVKRGKEVMREQLQDLLEADEEQVAAYRGIMKKPEEIPEKRATLEFMTLNPAFAYKWAGGNNQGEGVVIKEEIDLDNIWFWSNFSTDRPISESAVVVEKQEDEDPNAIKTDEFNLFKNTVETAQQF